MRLIKFLAILVLGMVSSVFVCSAQYEQYCKVDGNKFVITTPSAKLYPLPESYREAVTSGKALSYGIRDFVDISEIKPKTIRQSIQLPVVRYTNVTKSPNFDAYIVDYKDKLWVLQSSDVNINTLLVEQNAAIELSKEELESAKSSSLAKLQDLYSRRSVLRGELDSLVAHYAQISTDSLAYYRDLESRLPQIRDSLVRVAEREEQARVDKEYNSWYNSLPASSKAAVNAIIIDYAELDYPNSVGGCDYNFEYTNISPKTIKYLYWTGTAYNAVDDPVYCDVRNRSTLSGKDTGPVEQGESGGGYWDCVIYNYSAAYVKLSQVQIIYMDGSSLTISGDDIARIADAPSREISVDTWAIKQSVMSDIECQSKINLWSDRLSCVQNKKEYSAKWAELDSSSYNQTLSSLNELAAQEKSALADVANYQKNLDAFNKFLNFEKYATTAQKSATYTGGSSASASSTTSATAPKYPFVTFGLEGSLEGLKSFSAGLGLSMRIGRSTSLFNATIGAKYQRTVYNTNISYSYSDNLGYHYGDADYRRNVSQVVIPAIINWNIARTDEISFYLGVGYEHAVFMSDKQNLEYGFGDEFNISDFYKYGNDEFVELSVPARSSIIQIGFAGRNYDWKIYYKIHQPNSELVNQERGAIGTAFVYYF